MTDEQKPLKSVISLYQCRVEKRILNDSRDNSAYTALCYELELSDAPIVGRELRENRWFSGPLTHVVWDTEEDRFHVRVADEQPFIQGAEEFDHDWMVLHFRQQGWVLCREQIQRLG